MHTPAMLESEFIMRLTAPVRTWCFNMASRNAWKVGSSAATLRHFGNDAA